MPQVKSLDRRLATILLIVFVQMVGASMILPIIPLYAKNEFGMSPTSITLLATSFFAAQFLAGPFLGRLSDKVGRVPILLVSQVGTVISFIMLAFAGGPLLLFSARVLDGITGGNIIVAQAYVTDITPPEERTRSLGYIFAVFGAGFAIGPAIGGALASTGIRLPYIAAAIAASIVVILSWRLLDESLSEEERLERTVKREKLKVKAVLGSRLLTSTLIVGFVSSFGMGLIISTFSLLAEVFWLEGMDPKKLSLGVGGLLTIFGVGTFYSQFKGLKILLARMPEALVSALGTFFRGVGNLISISTSSLLVGIPAMAIMALGSGVVIAPAQSLATTALPDQFRGGVLGVFQSTTSLGLIFATAIGGRLFEVDPRLPFGLAGIIALFNILPALNMHRLQKKASVEPSTV